MPRQQSASQSELQSELFDAAGDVEPAGDARPQPARQAAESHALASRLHRRFGDRLHLGTSSWHFPGWAGLVWARAQPAAALSRGGLAAYAQHPLLRAVSLDRSFYRALDAAQFGALAAQVPADFRFVVKAPSLVCDAVRREPGSGRPLDLNPLYLDAAAALEQAAQPAATGLGERLGALVFQLSPLPPRWLDARAEWLQRLDVMLAAVRAALPPAALLAVEPRDPALLGPELAALLRGNGARCCLGLHDRMPALSAQLPMQRALWPGDLVCRWNLQRGQRYADAKDRWAPFDRLRAPDPETRRGLARVITATLDAGGRAFVTINNKAEGCAPQSVLALAQALDAG